MSEELDQLKELAKQKTELEYRLEIARAEYRTRVDYLQKQADAIDDQVAAIKQRAGGNPPTK